MGDTDSYLVYATSSYHYYLKALCEYEGFESGGLERQVFPDGERLLRLKGPVRDRNIILFGGTIHDHETLELYDLASGLVQHGANKLMMVVPYFGYSTMERAIKKGDIVTGKIRALLLSSIPRARVCNEIVMIDLHTPGIGHYFEGHILPYHIYSKRLIAEVIRNFADYPDVVLASTDAGRAKWVEHLANVLNIEAAFVYKRRLSGEHTSIRGINADVKGRHVVVYDDMIRTGGSLMKAARAYKEAGAKTITAITTHGVFPGESAQKIMESDLFDKVFVTDTHPRALEIGLAFSDDPRFEVHSMIPDLVDFIRNRDDFEDDHLQNH